MAILSPARIRSRSYPPWKGNLLSQQSPLILFLSFFSFLFSLLYFFVSFLCFLPALSFFAIIFTRSSNFDNDCETVMRNPLNNAHKNIHTLSIMNRLSIKTATETGAQHFGNEAFCPPDEVQLLRTLCGRREPTHDRPRP